MRCITYAGETLVTTDPIAAALVELTAALAKAGQAEAVVIPIIMDDGEIGEASLIVGAGNDVLSVPTDWEGEEPDFGVYELMLRMHETFPVPAATPDSEPGDGWDFDFDQNRG
jgi:hypothetical protein